MYVDPPVLAILIADTGAHVGDAVRDGAGPCDADGGADTDADTVREPDVALAARVLDGEPETKPLRELLPLLLADADGEVVRLAEFVAVRLAPDADVVREAEACRDEEPEEDAVGDVDLDGRREGDADTERMSAICAPVSAVSQTRTSENSPKKFCVGIPGKFPHMAAPLLTFCGGTKGAADAEHTAEAMLMKTSNIMGPLGADSGVAVKTTVCQAPSARLLGTHSLALAAPAR